MLSLLISSSPRFRWLSNGRIDLNPGRVGAQHGHQPQGIAPRGMVNIVAKPLPQ
jgi:hypothetical protein